MSLAPAPHKWGAFCAVGLGVLMATLDMGIVNVALPTLIRQLHTDFATIQWVILSYVLVITSLMLGVGRLGDMLGRKGVYITGVAIFTSGSLLCGLAPGVGWLIAFRSLQGLGAVMMQSLGGAIVVEAFPSSERGRALGAMGGVVSVGLALGPALGGVLIGLAGWRAVFLVNVPIGIIAGLAATRYVPSSIRRTIKQRFDFPGAFIMLLTLACYAFGMTLGQRHGFDYPLALDLLAATLVGLAAFVVAEKRADQPMVNLEMFRTPRFGLGLLMGFLAFLSLSGGYILLTFFLTLVKGHSVEKVGLEMMVIPLMMGLVAPWAGSLSDRFGTRPISLTGQLILIGGFLAAGTLDANVTELGYVLRLAPIGLGMGIFQSPNNSAIMGAAPPGQLGIASGLVSLSRTLGTTSGVPLIGAVYGAVVFASYKAGMVKHFSTAPHSALVAGIRCAYFVSAAIMAVGTILTITVFLVKKHRQSTSIIVPPRRIR
ncbi:MAG: MFS transporter [Deltaproteobacteria bacterium]|nr:MFS transporter [Deltaproteobacteria bacterium]